MNLKSLEFIFQILVEDKDSSWQSIMGKLLALEHLLGNVARYQEEITNIDEECSNVIGPAGSKDNLIGSSIGKEEILISLDVSFQNLNNSHCRVAKLALKVFIMAAKMLTELDPFDFEDVWNLVLTLEPTLQLTLRKKFKIAFK